MAVALVGTIGTAVQGAASASVSPSFGTSENRTAGNLLVLFVAVTETATLPTTPSGWTIAKQVAGTSCSATIYYKNAVGSDAAPSISGITSGLIAAQLAEYSGVVSTAVNQSGSATGTSSPVTATNAGADTLTASLILMAAADVRSVARSPNDTWTSNHVTTVTAAGNNNGTSSKDHYSFGYGTTNSASGADTAILTASVTTSITGIAVVDAVFKVGTTNPKTFTADSVLQKTTSATFTADATIKKTLSATFTADADIKKTLSATFTADAVIKKTLSATFTADAVIKKTISGSFTADAYMVRRVSGSFTADSVIKKTLSGTLTADSTIKKTFSTASLVQEVTGSGTTTATAAITPTRGNALIALVGNNSGSINQITVSDGVNSWARVVEGFNTGSTFTRIEIWVAYNVASTALTVSSTSASGTNHQIVVQEYAGLAGSVRASNGTGNASATSAPTGSITATDGDLVISAINYNTNSSARTASDDNVGGKWADAGIPSASASVGVRSARERGPAGSVSNSWTLSTASASGVVIAAFIPVLVSFTADAVLKRTFSGSFTADSDIKKTLTGSFTADSDIKKTLSGSFTADADIKKTLSSTFTADSVLKKTFSSTFTADSVIKKTLSGSFTADAYMVRRVSGSFTADSVLKKTASASFTADSTLKKTFSATFTADALLKKTLTGSITADSVIKKTISSSFTADAYMVIRQSGSFTANSTLKKTFSGSFAGDATLQRTQVFANGITKVADLEVAGLSFDLSGLGVAAGDIALVFAFRSNSAIPPTMPSGWTDTTTNSNDNTANISSKTVYRVIQGGDNLATISGTWTNSTSIAVIILRGQSGSPIGGKNHTNANTTTAATPSVTMSVADGSSWVVGFLGSKTSGASGLTLSSTTDEGSSDGSVNVATGRNVTSYANRNYTGSLSGNGWVSSAVEILSLFNPVGSPLTADATLKKTLSGTFTADAVVKKTLSGSFVADSVIKKTLSSTFTADADLKKTLSASFTADSVLKKTFSSSFVADAVIKKTIAGSFTADSYMVRRVSGSFTADAVLKKSASATFTADATIRKRFTSSFTSDSVLKKVFSGSFVSDSTLLKTFSTADPTIFTSVDTSLSGIYGTATDETTWVAVGKNGTSPAVSTSTTPESTWAIATITPALDANSGHIADVLYDGTEFVGVSPDAQISSSDAQVVYTTISGGGGGGGGGSAFDPFDRVEASGWGTPPSRSVAWDTLGSGATMSVDGGNAVAAATASLFPSAIYQDSAALPWDGAFTMYATWLFESALTGVNYIQPTWSFVGNTTDESFGILLYLTADVTDQSLLTLGGTGGSSDYNIPTNPSEGTTINLKVDYTPGGTTRAKIWWSPDAEPDWQVSRTDTTTNHTERKRLIVGGSQSYTSVQRYPFIDFGSGLATFDDFNRTTSDPSIGTSSSGVTYTGVGPTGSSTVNVDGSRLHANLAVGDGFYRDATGTGPWEATGGWIMIARVAVASVPTTPAHRVSYDFYSLPNYDLLEVDVSTDTGTGTVFLGSSSATFIDYADNTDFYIKWERRPSGVNRVRVWKTSDTEPSTWLIETTADATTITGFEIDLENNSAGQADLYIDNIDFISSGSGGGGSYVWNARTVSIEPKGSNGFGGPVSVAYSPTLNLYVIVGQRDTSTGGGGRIWTTSNMVSGSFTLVQSNIGGSTGDVTKVAWGGGQFVALSNDGTHQYIMTSSDGSTWATSSADPFGAGIVMNSMVYGNGTWTFAGGDA